MNIRTAVACAIAAILMAGCGGKGEGEESAAGKAAIERLAGDMVPIPG